MTTIDLSNEPQRAARCFQDYRSMGSGRSLSGLLDYYLSNPNSSPPVKTLQTLKRYSSAYSWQERIRQYEDAIANENLNTEIQQRKQEFLTQAKNFSDYHRQHGKLAFSAATRALSKIEDFLIKNNDCCNSLDDAVKLSQIVKALTPLSELWARALGIDRMLSKMTDNDDN